MKIRLKLLLPLVAVFFICFALFIAYLVTDQTAKKRTALNAKMDIMAELIATTNSVYLWNMDNAGVVRSIDSFLKDPEIVSISIKDQQGNPVAEKSEEAASSAHTTRNSDILIDGSPIGSAEVTFTDAPMKSEIGSIAVQIILVGLVMFLLIIVAVIVLANLITEPLRKLVSVVRDMSEGEGDLTVRLSNKGRDETADLSERFNVFLDKLLRIVVQVKQVGTKSAKLGNNLRANIARVSSSVTEIDATMHSMNERTELLNREIAKSFDGFTVLNENIDAVASLIDNQTAAVNESSASVEQMISNIAMIEKTTVEKMKYARELTEMAKSGDAAIIRNVEGMEGISRSTESISEMIQVINAVASQTNLLAMNAAIEAAHAGEFGKGFSVVADEIRKLAEQTGTNAKTISQSLNAMIKDIHETTATTKESSTVFMELIKGSNEVYESLNETIAGLQEMTIGNRQITEALAMLSEVTQNLRSSGKNMSEGTQNMQGSFQRIVDIAEANSRGIGEITSGVSEISHSILELNGSSAENSENARILEEEMAKFKI